MSKDIEGKKIKELSLKEMSEESLPERSMEDTDADIKLESDAISAEPGKNEQTEVLEGKKVKDVSLTDILQQNPPEVNLHEDTEDNLFAYSFEDVVVEEKVRESSGEHHASILDLKRKNTNAPAIADDNRDLSDSLSGKSLDDILKTPLDRANEWLSETRTISAQEREPEKKRFNLKLIIISVSIIIFVSVVGFYFAKFYILNKAVGESTKMQNVSFKSLKIPANLKDVNRLNHFLHLADSLFDSGEYNKAEIIYGKLLKTGWERPLLLIKLAKCRDIADDYSKAADYYGRAFKAGFKGEMDLVIRYGELLRDAGKYSRIISFIEPYLEEFPKNNNLHSLIAVAYFKEKKLDKAIASFKYTNPNSMTRGQLEIYAPMLEANGEKEKASRIYLDLARSYNDDKAYLKAVELSNDSQTRIAILAKMAGKFSGTQQGATYSVRMAEDMLKNGDKINACRTLASLDTSLFSIATAARFLLLLADCADSKLVYRSCQKILENRFRNNVEVQLQLYHALTTAGKLKVCRQLFESQYKKYQGSALANYMFGKTMSDPERKIYYYRSALKLQSGLYYAALDLGIQLCNKGDWKSALNYLELAIYRIPSNPRARYYSAIAETKVSGKSDALENYEKFLKANNVARDDSLKKLIDVAQYLPEPETALNYLGTAAELPDLKEYARYKLLQTKMIYGIIKKSDFPVRMNAREKNLYYIYLIAENDVGEAVSVVTTRDEFPAFWKVYLCWRGNIRSWKPNSKLLLQKYPEDQFIQAVCKLWLEKSTPAQAAKIISCLPYLKKPLLNIMIAEYFRKKNRKYKAENYYKAALNFPEPNMYSKLARTLEKR